MVHGAREVATITIMMRSSSLAMRQAMRQAMRHATEVPHPWSCPAQHVTSAAGGGQHHPEQSDVPKRSPHSFLRI